MSVVGLLRWVDDSTFHLLVPNFRVLWNIWWLYLESFWDLYAARASWCVLTISVFLSVIVKKTDQMCCAGSICKIQTPTQGCEHSVCVQAQVWCWCLRSLCIMWVYDYSDLCEFMQSASHSSGCSVNIACSLELVFKINSSAFYVCEGGTGHSFSLWHLKTLKSSCLT